MVIYRWKLFTSYLTIQSTFGYSWCVDEETKAQRSYVMAQVPKLVRDKVRNVNSDSQTLCPALLFRFIH